MRPIESKILDDVQTKYQVNFPNLANSEDLLTKTYVQFKNRKRPKFIIDQKHQKDHKDYEFNSIQKAFKLKTIKNLTPYDCSIILLRGPLINDDAYLYFLPRLLKHLLKDPLHEDLLSSRLKSLDKKNLSSHYRPLMDSYQISCILILGSLRARLPRLLKLFA